jgi:hypothetical protein
LCSNTVVLGALLVIGQLFVMRRRYLAAFIAVTLLGVAGFTGYVAYGKLKHNRAASCANCRQFMCGLVDDYAAAHDGWYPAGGTNALDSLSRCVHQVGDVHYFTSHAQAGRLQAYWQKRKTFAPDLCCYRYVEGMRTNDPAGLVLLYYWQPTRWECTSHKQPKLGRPVCFNSQFGRSWLSWEFLVEDEFQKRLAHTLAYLRERVSGRVPESRTSYDETNARNGRQAEFRDSFTTRQGWQPVAGGGPG